MAKGGSGDVLTGFISGLLASGYSEKESCLLGVYLHGMAGDLAASDLTQEGMQVSDLIAYLPKAWKKSCY
jgi:NAD(P)H-hydrate epimerase